MKTLAVVISIFVTFLQYSAEAAEKELSIRTAQDSVVHLVSRLYSEGDYKTVITLIDLTDSISLSPGLLYYQGISYAALYDYSHAQEYLIKAIARDSTNANYRFQYGKLLVQAGFPDEATEQLKKCIASDSTYSPALFQLGLLYNIRKIDPGKEAEIFLILIHQNPQDFLSQYYEGDALRRLDHVDSGMTFVQRSIELNPRYYPSLVAMAQYKNSKEDYAPALELYRRAESLRPKDKDLLNQMGDCFRKSGDLVSAIIYYQKSTAIDSSNDIVFAKLGHAYYALGNFDSSIHAYKKAIALDDENTLYYQNVALAYQKVDSVTAAILSYQKAIKVLHPENITYAYSSLAAFYYARGKVSDAVTMYQRNIGDSYFNLGRFYQSMKMLREALSAFQHMYEIDRERLDILARIGDIYEELHDTKLAILTYKKIEQALDGDAENSMYLREVKERLQSLMKKKK